MPDPDERVEQESSTVYELREDCVLCGHQLGPKWDNEHPRRCTWCGQLQRNGLR